MFHSRGRPRCRSYQINYDQLREGNPTPTTGAELLSDMPQTVTNNVKNVVGWRGGAERGFLAAYPDCIHVLTQNVTKEIPTTASWYLKVIRMNGKIFLGLMKPNSSTCETSIRHFFTIYPKGFDTQLELHCAHTTLWHPGAHNLQAIVPPSHKG